MGEAAAPRKCSPRRGKSRSGVHMEIVSVVYYSILSDIWLWVGVPWASSALAKLLPKFIETTNPASITTRIVNVDTFQKRRGAPEAWTLQWMCRVNAVKGQTSRFRVWRFGSRGFSFRTEGWQFKILRWGFWVSDWVSGQAHWVDESWIGKLKLNRKAWIL